MKIRSSCWILAVAWMCVGAANAADQDAPYERPTGVEITEVVVTSQDFDSDYQDVGRGWAYTPSDEEGGGCRIITPWHVVGDPANDHIFRDEILVSGPGKSAAYGAEIEDQSLVFLELDVGILKLENVDACPFSGVGAESLSKEGLFLRRRNEAGGIDQIIVDQAKGIIPQTDSFDVVKAYPDAAEIEGVKSGWSGSSVFLNGNRIGMVTEVRKGGREIYFVSAHGMQRLFGGRISLLEGSGAAPSAAGTALAQRGVSLNSIGLAELLAVADADALSLFREAGGTVDMTASALGRKIDDQPELVARQFFSVSENKPQALDWFAQELERGLDPNTLIPSDRYGEEAILASAIRSGNLRAIEILLEAGAAPHPIHTLEGVNISSPFMRVPLEAVADSKRMNAEERKRAATLLIRHGAVLPAKAIREASGEISSGRPKGRAQIGDRLHQTLNALNISGRTATPDLCAEPTPNMCKKATELYGFDWCNFLANMPKAFAGSGEGAHRITPFFLEYLIGIDRDAAHFLTRNEWDSTRIVSVSKDLSQVRVGDYGDNGNCRPRADGSTGRYCWDERLLRRVGDTNIYKTGGWGANFGFLQSDFCSIAAEWDRAFVQNAPNTQWARDLLATARPLDRVTISAHTFSSVPLTDQLVDQFAVNIINADKNLPFAVSNVSRNVSGDQPKYAIWSQAKTDPAKKEQLLDYLTRGELRNAPDFADADESLFAAYFFERELLADRDTQFLVPELKPQIKAFLDEIVRRGPPRDIYLVSVLPRLQYDPARQAFINGTNQQAQLGDFVIGKPIRDPRFVSALGAEATSRMSAYPDAVRDRYLLQLQPIRDDRVYSHANSENTVFPKRLGWSFSHRDNQIRASALALDRIVTLQQFKTAPAEAERLLKTTPRRTIQGEAWRLVTVLENAAGVSQSYGDPASPAKGFALTANVKEVLLLAPSGELVRRIPANEFPKAGTRLSLVNTDAKTKTAPFPAQLPLTPNVTDILLAKFQPNAVDQEMARGMFLSRWLYEKDVAAPMGGRFFNTNARAFSDQEVEGYLPEFRQWLLAAARRMPANVVATTEMMESVTQDGKSIRYSNGGCLAALYTERKLPGSYVASRMINSYAAKIQTRGQADVPDFSLVTFAANPGFRDCGGNSAGARSSGERQVSIGPYKARMPGNGLTILVNLNAPLDPASLTFDGENNRSGRRLQAPIRLSISRAELIREKSPTTVIKEPYVKLEASAAWANEAPGQEEKAPAQGRRRR